MCSDIFYRENYFCIFGKNNFSINCIYNNIFYIYGYLYKNVSVIVSEFSNKSIGCEGCEGKCFYLGKNDYYELRKNVLRDLADGFSCIHDNFKYFKSLNKNKVRICGPAEWLLDNIYLIEKEYKCVKKCMPLEYFKSLPYGSDYLEYIGSDECGGTDILKNDSINNNKSKRHKSIINNRKKKHNKESYTEDNIPRILVLAKKYINEKRKLELDDLVNYIRYFDSLEKNKNKIDYCFTMGELWAFPLMLRTAVMLKLSYYTNELVKVQKEILMGREHAENVLQCINKENLQEELEFNDDAVVTDDENIMSPLFLREFINVLRENSVKDKEIDNYLKLKWNLDIDYNSFLIKANLKEESLEQNISQYIVDIRIIEGISWRHFFEETSIVDRILSDDPAGVYKCMDFESKDYYRHKLEDISRVINTSEARAARNVLSLAQKSRHDNEEEYKCHVGYYIIEHGSLLLDGYYHDVSEVISQGTYVAINIGSTILLSLLFLVIGRFVHLTYTRKEFILSFLAIIIPINEIVVGIINYICSKGVKVRLVPKLDFSCGIPEQYKTIVVIPAIVNCSEKIKELMEKLEVYHCGNDDPNVYFALLSDFEDYNEEYKDSDKKIIECGLKYAEKLNEKYGKCGDKFFFLSRKRTYNEKMRIYMGRERKRGKLMEFMSLLRGYSDNTFDVISSPIDVLKDAKYIITLDEDTFMPRETVYKLVGAMSHVLNVPYMDKNNRVFRGYNIMQPKISISMEAKNATIFSRIFGGDSGVDGYSTAYSDTYEDLFGEGSFVGKGIINIDQFYDITNKNIKENRVLSHDLLEGALTRCALVSDVELVDGYPSYYESSCRRLYRWVRGDWQLAGWLFSRKITLLNKWKIFDNLRRSLLAPNLLLLLIISLTCRERIQQIAIICFLVLIMPLVFIVTDFVVTPKNRLMGAVKTFKQIMLIISFIPYESFLMIKAILLTLGRIIFTKRNLLEWQSANIEGKCIRNDLKSYFKRMWWGPFTGILIFLISLDDSIEISLFSLIPAVLWICSPYIAFYISRDTKHSQEEINEDDREYLRKLSRRIYAYYEDFVNKENNYLAPDNYQEKPFKGVAHRTSPTNIGMGLIANVTAYDLGYITMADFIDKTERILDSMRTLEKVHGHYLNWYDTRTKSPLYPRYVSTVDNGNLLANLWILKEAMEELKTSPVIRIEEITSVNDIYMIIEEENPQINMRFSKEASYGDYISILEEALIKLSSADENFDSETEYWLNKLFCEVSRKIENYHKIFGDIEVLYSREFLEGVPNMYDIIRKCRNSIKSSEDDFKCTLNVKINKLKDYLAKIDNIINEIDEISSEMNFKFLYNKDRGLFSIGYNVEENSLGNSYYDLFASECRIASFVAVSKNDIPKSHWFNLSRAMTNAFHTHSLVSWSGTMFEYFMPSLIMRNYPRTLLDQTYKGVIKAQMDFAKQKKVPWGISESAFHEFDNDENYQYKAFGIPGLGLKRGLEDEVVVSPYSTMICLPFCVKKGIENLKRLQGGGTLGRYGFIEAVDYTKAREDKFITGYNVDNNSGNVDNSVINVDKCEYTVDNAVIKNEENDERYIVDNVDNVNNFVNKRRNIDISTYLKDKKNYNNPQNDNKHEKIFSYASYPQEDDDIYNDGIKPNKISTYMVHHLGMSIMALDNVLKDNILINRFHNIPHIKASELLLKEKIPNHVTFERNEDYSIKNRYVKGEILIPRVFREKDDTFDEPQVLLLSNGEYSSMINIFGSGYSKKNDMMLYRWKGSSTSDDSGLFFYIKNLNSNDYWSSAFEPCRSYGDDYEAWFNLDKAKFSRRDGNIESTTEIALSTEENLEVRKITLSNIGERGRSIEITSYCEITLTSFSADSVHPAFSNLFIQTEYDEEEKMLLGSRRGRVKGAKVPYIFQKIIVNGECEGEITYETSRINFIGRNRNLKTPEAMDNDKSLNNTCGTVLDPILSMRVRVRIAGGEKREIYFITGTVNSKEEAVEISQKYNDNAKAERIFNKYSINVQLELKNLEIKSIQAELFQNLSSYIFYLQKGRKYREQYIRNIKKHQKDLWAYGISGDLPIVLLTIEDENDISLVITIIKFYSYLKLKGVKIDLIIYNDEELSYDEPLKKSIMQAVNMVNAGNNLNKSGGIYIHNKSTMNLEIKEFLIGISRLYVDSKNGTLLEQFRKCEEMQKEKNISVQNNIYSRSNILCETQNSGISEMQRAEYVTKTNPSFKGKEYNNFYEDKNKFEKGDEKNNINGDKDLFKLRRDSNKNKVVGSEMNVNDVSDRDKLSAKEIDLLSRNIRTIQGEDDFATDQAESDVNADKTAETDINVDNNSEIDINVKNNSQTGSDYYEKTKINYDEYDHDVDLIKDNDLLKGISNCNQQHELYGLEKVIQDTKHIKNESSCNPRVNISDKVTGSNELKKSVDQERYEGERKDKSQEDYSKMDLDFFNGYGGFDKSDGTYVIRLSNYKNTPAPWINVMSNSDFGFHISETGSSYTWCGNSRENKITPWSNDYIRDPLGEALYIRDDKGGRYFSISPEPVRDENEYIIKHGFGYSQFMHTAYGIKGEMKVFAPRNENVKLQIVRLKNLMNEERDISIFYYAKLVLGVYGYESERYISTYFKEDTNNTVDKNIDRQKGNVDYSSDYNDDIKSDDNCYVDYIGGNNPYSEFFGDLHAYLTILGGDNLTVCGDTKEFIGCGRDVSTPNALNHDRLSNRTGSIYDPCLSACSSIKLKAHETKEILIVFGQDTEENIAGMISKYRNMENAHVALENVKEYWHDFLGNIQVSTPDKSMNYMLNGWLLYQTLSCRYLSRSAFYQSGGAYGFRDQLQDSLALGVVDSEITKSQIVRSASRQYIEGDVQHWWHPVVNSGIRTRFSDDLLWMPYVTAEYIKSTGDYSILDIEAAYLEDEPLREGEDERYTIVHSSSASGTIYEHCQKAIKYSLKFGEHNIPLIGSGDWNDGMSTVGNKGKGESVWLGWFLYDILSSFEKIAEQRDDIKNLKYYRYQKEFIKENIEKNAWDGGWYRRAYFDDGTPLGSRENPECQIDSLAQSWAVISGAAKISGNSDEAEYDSNTANNHGNTIIDKSNNSSENRYTERAVEAMAAVEKNLVKKDKGMILLLAPPFNNSYLEPGYIKGYVAGVRENGGQYTHAAVWVILAMTKLGYGNKAAEYYNMINPINHSQTELECMVYKTEPYVMSADVYIKEPHGGRGGWSWYTGASGWMYRVGIENILGLKRIEDKGYEINPCVPDSWNEYELRIKNKTEDYIISVKRINRDKLEKAYNINKEKLYIKINNEIYSEKLIPRNAGHLDIEVFFS